MLLIVQDSSARGDKNRFVDALKSPVRQRADNFTPWTFEEPLWIRKSTDQDFARLQTLMVRLIRRLVQDYRSYAHIMPLDERVQAILDLWEPRPYRVGTYRTDFVIDRGGQARIIEITCRYALNGNSTTLVMNEMGRRFRASRGDFEAPQDRSEPLLRRLCSLLDGVRKFCILQGADDRNDSKLLLEPLRAAGYEVEVIPCAMIPSRIDDLDQEDCLVVSELAVSEIVGLGIEVNRRLARMNVINDYRTVILIHDKRFFAVMGDPEFLASELNDEETAFFRRFYIPTFSATQRPDLWKQAPEEKDRWIAKHRNLGMSQRLLAGPVATPEEWRAFLAADDARDLTLQAWVETLRVESRLGDEERSDYLVGTFMFFDDEYFGLGPFRLSSFPVTNLADDRKAFGMVGDAQPPEGVHPILMV